MSSGKTERLFAIMRRDMDRQYGLRIRASRCEHGNFTSLFLYLTFTLMTEACQPEYHHA
ncbi:MAG: hypothetical protein JWQ21_2116 [Herminiimonas sp.]|nr:hypothetical protein [Herminiimonas sp.]